MNDPREMLWHTTKRLIALAASSPHTVKDGAGTEWDWSDYVVNRVGELLDDYEFYLSKIEESE